MTKYKVRKPVLTVYMPVFNAQDYVGQAIESILSQTYSNFEFIIIDDHSTDNSWRLIKKYARLDKRIRIYRNKVNMGVSLTSNIAISCARGKYLARMDADDISFPGRLEQQIQYFQNHKNVSAIGGQCICIDPDNRIVGYKKFPFDFTKIMSMIFWAIPLQQSSMMINRSLLPKNFIWFDQNKTSAEEIDLMFRLSTYGPMINLPDFLLYYRQLPDSLSHKNPKQTYFLTLKSRISALKNGFRPTTAAIIMNLVQFGAVLVLPAPVILMAWNTIRGINNAHKEYPLGSLATT